MHDVVRLIMKAQHGEHVPPREFADALMQDVSELETNAGVEFGTVHLDPHDAALQFYMRTSLLVIAVITRMTLEPSSAVRYFRYLPVEELSGQTPEMLVSQGQAIDLLLRLDR